MQPYHCIHTSDLTQICAGQPEGLLCYVVPGPQGEYVPHVDLSCDDFFKYHYHHGGLGLLLAWQLNSHDYKELAAELNGNKDQFGLEIGKFLDQYGGDEKFAPLRAGLEKGILDAYDSLVKTVEERSN